MHSPLPEVSGLCSKPLGLFQTGTHRGRNHHFSTMSMTLLSKVQPLMYALRNDGIAQSNDAHVDLGHDGLVRACPQLTVDLENVYIITCSILAWMSHIPNHSVSSMPRGALVTH